MIVGSFFPSISPPGTSYLTQFTDFIDNITIEDPNKIAEAYYMGYIPYNQLPSTYKISKLNISTGGVISFDDVTKQENAPWFYTGRYYTSIYNRYIQGIYKLNTSTGRFESLNLGTSGTKQYGFVNGAEIATLTTQGNFTIHFTCQMSESDGTYIDWWNDVNNAWHHFNLTVAQFLGFMAGTYAIHFSFSQYGTSGSFDMYYNDLKDGTYTYTDSVSGRKMRIFITSFSTPDPFVDYDSEGTQRYFSDICAAALLHVNHEDGVLPYIINYNGWHYGYVDANYISVSISENNVTMSNRLQLYSNYLCGGWSGSVPREFWSNPNGETEVFGNMVAINHHTNLDGRLYRIFTPDDIMRAFVSMFTRLFTEGNTGYGYSTGKYWSLFNEDNSPKWEFADGDFNSIVTKLRPWQISNITVNTFTPDDVPAYGEYGEDGDGDNIRPPAISGIGDLKGFITMYALKPSQLANLGAQLWSSFTSPDFWNSISVVLDNTLSVDPSNILNYVISVRAFPFDLSLFGSSELPEIFFGRGLVGIPVDVPGSASIYSISDCVALLPGGELDVPAYYGDFRDMEPCCKMILHLPFCGSCEINPSQVVGKHLQIYYSVDFCTGALMGICLVSGAGLSMEYPVATMYGQIGATVQLSASNEMEALQCLAGASMGVASGLMGNVSGMMSGAVGVATSLANNRAMPHTTGKSSGFSGFYEPRVPYIEMIYDQYYIPENYGHVHGYACNVKKKIGDLHGYTVCRNVDTTGLSCETDERLSIKRILESGFFAD